MDFIQPSKERGSRRFPTPFAHCPLAALGGRGRGGALPKRAGRAGKIFLEVCSCSDQ